MFRVCMLSSARDSGWPGSACRLREVIRSSGSSDMIRTIHTPSKTPERRRSSASRLKEKRQRSGLDQTFREWKTESPFLDEINYQRPDICTAGDPPGWALCPNTPRLFREISSQPRRAKNWKFQSFKMEVDQPGLTCPVRSI